MTTQKKYNLGLLDPPWDYSDKQGNDPARGGITYPVLTIETLCDIPIGNAFHDNSVLIVWVTLPKLMDKLSPLDMIRAWGFRPVTALFVWIKTNKRGEVVTDNTNLIDYDDYYSGLGRYTNSNAEIAIIARRGKMLERLDKTVKQLIVAPIGKHSAKPQEQYSRIERLFGDVSRVELFARKENPPPNTWDATGLDYDGVDINNWIKQYSKEG